MRRLLASISLAAILILATFLTYNLAGAQQQGDQIRANNSTGQTISDVPSVIDSSLMVEPAVEGLVLPTAMAFLDEHRILVLEKDNGTVRMVQNGSLKSEPM